MGRNASSKKRLILLEGEPEVSRGEKKQQNLVWENTTKGPTGDRVVRIRGSKQCLPRGMIEEGIPTGQ